MVDPYLRKLRDVVLFGSILGLGLLVAAYFVARRSETVGLPETDDAERLAHYLWLAGFAVFGLVVIAWMLCLTCQSIALSHAATLRRTTGQGVDKPVL